jgi:hypothetical protein
VFVVAVVQWIYPMRLVHLIAVLVQIVPMYLLLCIGGNFMSIRFPMTLRSGSGKPAPNQGMQTLIHLLLMPVVSFAVATTFVPLGLEALLVQLQWFGGFPAFLVVGLLQAAAVVYFYGRILNVQGRFLHLREQKILEIVSAKGE